MHNAKKLMHAIDKQIDEFLTRIKCLEGEREELLDENFELQAQVKALKELNHEQRRTVTARGTHVSNIPRGMF